MIEKKLLNIGETAQLLGVNVDTLREWDTSGALVPVRTPGGHRRYKISDLQAFMGEEEEEKTDTTTRVCVYARVSSNEQKQKGDLERQSNRLMKYCIDKGYFVVASFEEVASGMSDDRTKLNRLFKLVESGDINKVIIEHRDRLCRFMYNFLVRYFESHGVEIEYVEEIIGTSYEQELVEDILSLMASFSNKIYGKRSAENRKKRKAEKEQGLNNSLVHIEKGKVESNG